LVLFVLLFFSVNINSFVGVGLLVLNGMVYWISWIFIGFIGIGCLVLFSWVYLFGCGVLELIDFINEK